ncbi:hypothetical protein F2P81_023748 [Scophthalmus maximus]|uniref:Uncharacterized protein n=1 Tax=Scophthalmus maximus TaxID=52904 RepID=A0A6A4RSV3_SCOMX|nr:hypothetical protein F2P81_023748 [Scophthalmus maximus]
MNERPRQTADRRCAGSADRTASRASVGQRFRKTGKPYPFDTLAAWTDISDPISAELPDVCPEGPKGAEEWLKRE